MPATGCQQWCRIIGRLQHCHCAKKVSRPVNSLLAFKLSEKLTVIGSIISILTGITGGIDARRASQCIHFQSGVIVQRQ